MFFFLDRNLAMKEQVYNHRHCRARRMIENAFGILAARWRILGRAVELHSENFENMVKACVALHNYLVWTDASNAAPAMYIPPDFADATDATGDVCHGDWRRQMEGDSNLLVPGRLSGVRASRAAHLTRHNFGEFFQSSQGLVPWQVETVRRGCLQ